MLVIVLVIRDHPRNSDNPTDGDCLGNSDVPRDWDCPIDCDNPFGECQLQVFLYQSMANKIRDQICDKQSESQTDRQANNWT